MNDSTGHHQVHKIFDPLQQEVSLPLNNLNSLSLTFSYFRILKGIRDNHFTKLAPHKQESMYLFVSLPAPNYTPCF